MRYILRLLGLPFFMGLLIIPYTYLIILKSYLWIRYGGEATNYSDKLNRKSITETFYKLQEHFDAKQS
jgi:hypothetical protein